jgi:hypothetical protein
MKPAKASGNLNAHIIKIQSVKILRAGGTHSYHPAGRVSLLP